MSMKFDINPNGGTYQFAFAESAEVCNEPGMKVILVNASGEHGWVEVSGRTFAKMAMSEGLLHVYDERSPGLTSLVRRLWSQ